MSDWLEGLEIHRQEVRNKTLGEYAGIDGLRSEFDKKANKSSVLIADDFAGANDTAKWQAAIEYASENGGATIIGRKMAYTLTNLLCTASNIVLDFNGASITADPTTSGNNGAPMIYFKGSYGEKRTSSGPIEGVFSVTVPGFGSEFSANDFVIVGDAQIVPAWNFGLTASPGSGYGGRWEVNQVKSVAGDVLTLRWPTSRDYNGTSPFVQKMTPVRSCGVKNIASLTEVDPGASQPDVDVHAPHIISFDAAVFPSVENVHVDGFALHVAHFRNSIRPFIGGCSAKNGFRPNIGGQAYLARFQRCRAGRAVGNLAVNVRHLLSDVQSVKSKSVDNMALDLTSYGVGCHGHDAVDFKSVDDRAEGGFVPFNAGNTSFSRDRRTRFIRPSYRGSDVACVIWSGAEDTEIIDPDFPAGSRAIQITSGAKRTKIRGGRIKSGSDVEAIIVRDKALGSDTYGLRCSDVSIVDVDIDGSLCITNNVLGIECDGVIEVVGNRFVTAGAAPNVVDVATGLNVSSLVVSGNRIFGGGHQRFIRTQSIPSSVYEVRGNYDPFGSVASSFVQGANFVCEFNKFGNVGFAATGSAVFDNGALIARNEPFQSAFQQYNRETFKLLDTLVTKGAMISGKIGANRELYFNTQSSTPDNRYDQASARFILRLASDDGTFQILARDTSGAALRTQLLMNRTTGLSKFGGPVGGAGYTLASLPSASDHAGAMVHITDRSNRPAYSNGTNWKWIADDVNVS